MGKYQLKNTEPEGRSSDRLLVVSPLLEGAESTAFTLNHPVVVIKAPGHNGPAPGRLYIGRAGTRDLSGLNYIVF